MLALSSARWKAAANARWNWSSASPRLTWSGPPWIGSVCRPTMATALVLTGVTRREDLDHPSVRPDHVLESIAELPRLFDSESKT
jgi:hypothetical protein